MDEEEPSEEDKERRTRDICRLVDSAATARQETLRRDRRELLRAQATATIEAGIQLAKEAALGKWKELELAKQTHRDWKELAAKMEAKMEGPQDAVDDSDAADDSSAAAKATFPFLNSSQVSIRVRDNVSGSTRDMNHCIFLQTSADSNLDFGVII